MRKKIETFESVRLSFICARPPRLFTKHKTPSTNSVRDRFLRLDERSRDAVRKNEIQSGNSEVVTDTDVLLDELIHEKNEWRETRRAERDAQTERDNN